MSEELVGIVESPAEIIAELETDCDILVHIVETGAKGDTGYAPVKGVDYFTQSDVQSMVADVVTITGGDLKYVHDQMSASAIWTINHNLGKYPAVMIIDSGGTVVVGDISYTSINQVVLVFTAEFCGKAYLN